MTSTKVKAWTYHSPHYPSCLNLSDIDPPASPPARNHIQIRTHAVALNPVDIQLMNFPLFSLPYLSGRLKIPCGDFSGTVIASAAEGYSSGEEVFGFCLAPGGRGCLAEVLDLDVGSGRGKETVVVVKKPEGWSHVQAASLPLVWLTARSCVEVVERDEMQKRTDDNRRKIVVLGGSSGVGIYVVHMARERGWSVLASCSGRNVDFVKGMGAEEVVDYTTESVKARVQAFRPDAIVDCVGGTEMLGIARRYVTIVGDKTDRSSVGGSLIYSTHPRMYLRWFLGWMGWGDKYDCIDLAPKKDSLEEALHLPADKIIVDSTFRFEDAKDAFERLNTGRARGKVVVEF